ncbi:ANTAR domain-containing response regulator [Cohnella suwonensis]|uniref:ANTAR domain-containing response regulator n=1 Tax=Cohnella suwonensis TaxID=696072 RepID=A0ABW0LY96_9BACL
MDKTKILLADDDPIIRMDIREMLEERGYRVAGAARNGEEAVELAARLKPDLVLLDVKMPRMSGLKAARLIRRIYDPAIVLVTAYSERDTVREAGEADVSAYLVKPVSELNLFPAIEIALSQQSRIDGLKKALASLERSAEERRTVEKAKGLLMQAHALNEEEAYRFMRGASMDSRLSLGKFAEAVLQEREERMPDKAGNG